MSSIVITTGAPTPTARGAVGTLRLYDLQSDGTLALTHELLKAGVMPMFVASVQGKGLFVVDSGNNGRVHSFTVRDGKIQQINECSSGGKGPCHISSHRDRSGLLVANYEASTVAFIPVAKDGYLLQPSCVCKHTGGATPGEGRQDAPHPHGIYSDPCTTADLIRVADLGSNEIVTYEMKTAADTFTRVGAVRLHKGAGPRHMAWGRGSAEYRAYVVNELDNTISILTCSGSESTLVEATYVSSIPSGWSAPPPFDFYTAPNHAAEIRALPTGDGGDWVLVSNRGHDSVALLHAPKGDPSLKLARTVSSNGRLPWSFDIYPAKSGAKSLQLLIANQFSASLGDPGNVTRVSMSLDVDAAAKPTPVPSSTLVSLPKILFTQFLSPDSLCQPLPTYARVEVRDVVHAGHDLDQDSVELTLVCLHRHQHYNDHA